MGKANQGKWLEDRIIEQCDFYERNGIGTFAKIPNNWVVRRKGPHIIGANPVPSGLCDFIGTTHIFEGRIIVFDAKETTNKTNFPLKNIKPGQMDHMREVNRHGGIAFLLVYFAEHHETYILPFRYVETYWEYAEDHPDERGAKSIPLTDIRTWCEPVHDFEILMAMEGVEW